MSPALGTAAALAAPLLMTIGFVVWDKIWKGSPVVLNAIKCTLATIVFLLIVSMIALIQQGTFLAGTSMQVMMLMVSAVIGIVIGDNAWLYALQLLGARRVIVADVLKPFLAAVVGAVALGESVGLMCVLGIFVTMGGVLVVSLDANQQDGSKQLPGHELVCTSPAASEKGDGSDPVFTESDVASRQTHAESPPSKLNSEQQLRPGSPVKMLQVTSPPKPLVPEPVEGCLATTQQCADQQSTGSCATSQCGSVPVPQKSTTSAFHVFRPSETCQVTRELGVGYMWAAINVVLDVLGAFLTRYYGNKMNTFDINSIRFGSAAAILVLALLCARTVARVSNRSPPKWSTVPAMTPREWAAICTGVLFVTFGAPALANYALFEIPIGVCLTLTSVSPVYALPLTYISKGERVSLRSVVGSVAACAGVAMLYL